MKLTQQGKAAQFKKDKVFRIKKKQNAVRNEYEGMPWWSSG